MSTVRENTARQIVERSMGHAAAAERAEQLKLYASDAVVEFPFAPAGVPDRFAGHDEIRAMWDALDAGVRGSDVAVRRERSSVVFHETTDPDVVVVELTAYLHVPSEDNEYLLRQIHVYRLRDGLISEVRDYFAGDTAGLVSRSLAPTGQA